MQVAAAASNLFPRCLVAQTSGWSAKP